METYDPSPPKREDSARPTKHGQGRNYEQRYGTESHSPPPVPYPIPHQYTFCGPYYLPPFYPIPPIRKGPPMHEVDQRLPTVPFKQRPLALKLTIGLLIVGIGLCLGFITLRYHYLQYGGIITIIMGLFAIISIFGIISIIFLIVPKKVGWYFAMITASLALTGLGIGTLIAIFTIFALMWPSNRYYFHTGEYPPYSGLSQSSYSTPPYPVDHLPRKIRRERF